MKKKFALIGLGGYIAPRHLKAIKETGNELIVAMDKDDSVGIIDSFFPKAKFFVDFSDFDNFIHRYNNGLDYMTICTPNHYHKNHISYALRNGMDAICEKPIVIDYSDIDYLKDLKKKTGKEIYTILQLRIHPAIKKLKEKVENNPDKVYEIDLNYITPRGDWYFKSWKGDVEKSGDVASNIGIHFFDMLVWIFGDIKKIKLGLKDNKRMAGYLELEKAKVRWYLSVDRNDLKKLGKDPSKAFRALTIGDESFDFSSGFTDLHTKVYEEIFEGRGFTIEDAEDSIKAVTDIRSKDVESLDESEINEEMKKLF